METVLSHMLARYDPDTIGDRKNALKEIVQEVALCGLSRAGFFDVAAFYGGTALRIFHGLDRFSEDLDFSLVRPDPGFELKPFFPALKNELASVGLDFTVEEKTKSAESVVRSAYLRGNARELILGAYADADVRNVNPREVVRVKFEIDTDPPAGATYENRYGLLPAPYRVRLHDVPSLFAGKIHAVVCRAWKNRVKGRDLYDYVFYLSRGAKVNGEHLRAKLVRSGFIGNDFTLSRDSLVGILEKRFRDIDYEQAKQDVFPFVRDKDTLNIWCAEFFIDITKNIALD